MATLLDRLVLSPGEPADSDAYAIDTSKRVDYQAEIRTYCKNHGIDLSTIDDFDIESCADAIEDYIMGNEGWKSSGHVINFRIE